MGWSGYVCAVAGGCSLAVNGGGVAQTAAGAAKADAAPAAAATQPAWVARSNRRTQKRLTTNFQAQRFL